MSEPQLPPVAAPEPPTNDSADAAPRTRGRGAMLQVLGWVVVSVAALGALGFAWRAGDRMQALEQELVRRQQDSQTQATEASVMARQAQDWSREAVTKAALLEGRVAEVAQQRGQLDELIGSLSRSRDENLLADIEASVRVAQQQSAITGSAEPLVAALRAADERLGRVQQPRLDAVRRAIGRDLDRIKGIGVSDLTVLASRLDEGMRLVEDAPLLAFEPAPHAGAASAPTGAASSAAAEPTQGPLDAEGGWGVALLEGWRTLWTEVVALVRVTRIDAPEAMLLAPEQRWFLRENLKLRLLNARVALLSRQFDIAQADLQVALSATERHFDRNARKTAALRELVRSVAVQARHAVVPRPDDTLAALSAAAAGR